MQSSLWLLRRGQWWGGTQGRMSCVFLQVCLPADEVFLQVSMAGAGEAGLLRSWKSQWMFWGIMGRTDIELAVGKQGLGTTSGWGMLVPVTVMEGWGGADLYWGRGQEFCTYSLAQLRGVRRTRAPWLMCPGNRDHHAGQVGVQSGSTHTGCVQTKETGEMRLLFGTCQPFLP